MVDGFHVERERLHQVGVSSLPFPSAIVILKKWCQMPTKPPTILSDFPIPSSSSRRLLTPCHSPSSPNLLHSLFPSLFRVTVTGGRQIVMETSANSGKPNRPPTARPPPLPPVVHQRSGWVAVHTKEGDAVLLLRLHFVAALFAHGHSVAREAVTTEDT